MYFSWAFLSALTWVLTVDPCPSWFQVYLHAVPDEWQLPGSGPAVWHPPERNTCQHRSPGQHRGVWLGGWLDPQLTNYDPKTKPAERNLRLKLLTSAGCVKLCVIPLIILQFVIFHFASLISLLQVVRCRTCRLTVVTTTHCCTAVHQLELWSVFPFWPHPSQWCKIPSGYHWWTLFR